MHIPKLLILVLLGLSVSAVADFRTITEAYEVGLTDLRLPGTEGGTLAIDECDDCDALTLRVTAATRYVLNDRDVTLAQFKKAVSRIINRGDVVVDVFHHLESNTVTAVKVSL